MYTMKRITILSPCDLYRDQARRVSYAAKHAGSQVRIERLSDHKQADTAHLLSLLSLGVQKGDEISLQTRGREEDLFAVARALCSPILS